tara:strand:+ start:193323 stop:194054 length:732 start_codon:yes stop_codon:yes gene_type:complete
LKKRLIAHRGDMVTYPENTLLAIQSALNLGMSYIEIDVQLSRDAVPMVVHDASLLRTAGVDKNIYDLTSKQLDACLVNYSNTDDHEIEMLRIPTLQSVVDIMNNYSETTLFVEIKKQSIEYFGLQVVVDAVLKVLANVKFKVVIISFVADVISFLKSRGDISSGWAVSKFDQQHKQLAQQIQPDFLFCNIEKINDIACLWNGSWQWALYDVRDPAYACELLTKGVHFIETGDIVKLANAKECQ